MDYNATLYNNEKEIFTMPNNTLTLYGTFERPVGELSPEYKKDFAEKVTLLAESLISIVDDYIDKTINDKPSPFGYYTVYRIAEAKAQREKLLASYKKELQLNAYKLYDFGVERLCMINHSNCLLTLHSFVVQKLEERYRNKWFNKQERLTTLKKFCDAIQFEDNSCTNDETTPLLANPKKSQL